MANEENKAGDTPPQVSAVRIVPDIPVVFSDGVLSQAFALGVSKFYLYRTDTAPNVLDGTENVPVAQVIMTAQGFAAMLHFFEHRLQLMIKDGAITQEAVDKVRETIYEEPLRETVYPTDKK